MNNLSSVQRTIEQFLAGRPFERGPWLAVAYAAGIAGWAMLHGPWQWGAWIALCAAAVLVAQMIPRDGGADHLRLAIAALALMAAAGCATIWMKSALVGRPALPMRETVMVAGRIVDRRDDGAAGRVRLLLAARIAGRADPALIQVDVPDQMARAQMARAQMARAQMGRAQMGRDLGPDLVIGATIIARARLAPPAPPLVPGAHDFAFVAWFAGVVATGSIDGRMTIRAPAPDQGGRSISLRGMQHAIHDHVLAHLGGAAGAIAATLASGDRGAVSRGDADAMRDAGFAHLISISGLHVGVVIGGTYLLIMGGLGLFPWIVLRVRLPVVAALGAALAGLVYCLITGSQVPTLRAAAGGVLVLAALALGRNPLSMRLLAVSAVLVLCFWPESLFGASFQMSYGAVMTIIALYGAGPVRRFVAWRDEGRLNRAARHVVMALVGGLAIECALLPVALFHFHRAGLYGALANALAIPLVTLITMPALALALVLDSVGCGGLAWWVTGRSIDLMLWLAHTTAAIPGAVATQGAIPGWIYGVWVTGAVWLALWSGRVRWWGLVPIALALIAQAMVRPPDILISGDGRHVAIAGLGPEPVVFDQGQGPYASDVLLETAGLGGTSHALESWPGARCTHDFCALAIVRDTRRTVLLIARSHRRVNGDALAVACGHSDIVIADHLLPGECHPRQMLADARLLAQTGGLAIDLASGSVRTVAQTSGTHPWLEQPSAITPPQAIIP